MISEPYKVMADSDLLPRLNNQGRRPETVLFSWLRGYAVVGFFIPAISRIFEVEIESVKRIGDDELNDIDTFRRSPKADLELGVGGQRLRIEVQSGFQGVNDIKEHKVREATRIYETNNIKTACIHVDLFNGQAAFVQLDCVRSNDVNWVTRQQMEGQSVFSIDQNYFKWRLLDPIPALGALELTLR